MFNPKRLVLPTLLSLQPYQAGKPIAECQREFGLTKFIKLASNENPLGTSPLVTVHLAQHFKDIARYPDPSMHGLKKALSRYLKIEPNQLIIGNGSEEVLRLLLQAFVFGDYHVMLSEYAFSAYKILAQGAGLEVKEIPAFRFGVDLNAMLTAVTSKTRMIILANPNNPTGTYITAVTLRSFLEKLSPEIIVVLDEAYYEYVSDTEKESLALSTDFSNVVITRTFSKAYGLAGLRLGYGIAYPEIVELVNRIRQPFNVNHLAQVAGEIALADQDFIQKAIALNERGKKQFYEGLAKLGLIFIPTQGNFIMVRVKLLGREVFQSLLRLGVIVRPLDPYQLPHHLRITIGTQEENTLCLKALEEVLLKGKVI